MLKVYNLNIKFELKETDDIDARIRSERLISLIKGSTIGYHINEINLREIFKNSPPRKVTLDIK